jgi:TM2 domain-containing membrane protein YozV
MRIILTALILTGIVTFSSYGGEGDSAVVLKPKVAKYDYDAIPKDPLASAFFSATIPGSGQIYNKEYLRGIITAVGFFAGYYTAYYMLGRWDALNTDTVYVPDAYDPYKNHTVVVSKPSDQQVGLPTDEKIILGTSALMAAGFWVWGIYDSYRGAKRYNQKLFAEDDRKFSVRLALSPDNGQVGIKTRYRF